MTLSVNKAHRHILTDRNRCFFPTFRIPTTTSLFLGEESTTFTVEKKNEVQRRTTYVCI